MELTLTVTPDEVNMLFAGLGKLPLEASVGLWMKLQQQAGAQMQPQQPAASPDPIES